MKSNFKTQAPGLPFTLLTTLFLIICVATLDRSGYWLDEVLTVTDLRLDFFEMVRARALAGHGPVYFSLAWIWQRLVGEGELATRLLPLCLGLIGLALFYALLLRISDRTTALLSTVLLFANATLLLALQEARPYSLTLPLVAAACFLLLRYENQPTTRKLFLLTLLAALAVNTHLAAALPLAGLIFYLLFRPQPARPPALAISAGLLFALPLLVVLILYRNTTGPVIWLPPMDLLSILQVPLVLAGICNLPLGNLDIPVAIVLSVLAFKGVRRFGDHGRLLLYLWLTPMLFAVMLSFLLDKNFLFVQRYFVVPAMAQSALLAGGLLELSLPRNFLRLAPAAAVTALFLWGAAFFFSVPKHLDIRQALPELQNNLKKQEQLIIFTRNPKWFTFYNRDLPYRTQILQVRIVDDRPALRGHLHIRPSTTRVLIVIHNWDVSREQLSNLLSSDHLILVDSVQIHELTAFYAIPIGRALKL